MPWNDATTVYCGEMLSSFACLSATSDCIGQMSTSLSADLRMAVFHYLHMKLMYLVNIFVKNTSPP